MYLDTSYKYLIKYHSGTTILADVRHRLISSFDAVHICPDDDKEREGDVDCCIHPTQRLGFVGSASFQAFINPSFLSI